MNIKEQFITLKTITEKEIVRILRIWPQTILPPMITISLYFIIFGEILFKNKTITILGENISYTRYLIPGLLIMAIINNTYHNASFSLAISKFHKSIEEVIISPTPNVIVILGLALGSTFRGLLNGIMVFITILFFQKITIYSITATISVAFLTAMFFSSAGIINAILARNFDDVSWFPSFVLTPMVYLGGIFFSIDMLPDNWQVVAQLNPIYHFVKIFRYHLLGIGKFSYLSLMSIIATNILLFIAATIMFKKKMQK